MILYPAIDILDGKAVRLVQGRFDDATVYDDDPLAAAQAWEREGARFLHVVDLDGARDGHPVNLEHIERICKGVRLPVQVGGGMRDLPAVRDVLRAGAERVILGTAAYSDQDFLDAVCNAYGPRVLVAIDVRGGNVATSGWTETTQMPAESVIERLQRRGITRFVYTSIERDGKLEGIDLDEVARIADTVRGRFIYSGGVGSMEDLKGLVSLRRVNLAGVIAGKSLYERRFTIEEGHAVLDAG